LKNYLSSGGAVDPEKSKNRIIMDQKAQKTTLLL
jgi:hypothetical protein